MEEEFIKKESGGKTKIILVTRVHKEAAEERMEKLIDEIKFLEKIPEKWRIHFPEIIVHKVLKDRVYYEMPYYPFPSMRRLLFSKVFTYKEALKWIDKVLSFSFEMYKHEVIPMPENYIEHMHFNRVRKRLDEIYRKTEIFKKIIPMKEITINGKGYKNILFILNELERKPEIIGKCLPEYVSKWGHFDLHFSNILIDLKNDNFILVDPRGYRYCDYYYDYGKLWHSVNGKYEFIAEGRFTLNGTNFELERNDVYFEFEKIKSKLPTILAKYSNEPKDVILWKTEFNEAMHFSALIPYQLEFDGKEHKALAAYYQAVILLNRFIDNYGD